MARAYEEVGKQKGETEQDRDVEAQQPAVKETIQDFKYSVSRYPKIVLHFPSRQKHLTLQTAHAHGPLHICSINNKQMGISRLTQQPAKHETANTC